MKTHLLWIILAAACATPLPDDAAGDTAVDVEASTSCAGTVCWQGGPVMTGTTNFHFIWYGDWDLSTMVVINSFVEVVGGSTWLSVVESYTGPQPSAKVSVGSAVLELHPTLVGDLTADQIEAIVADEITSGKLPLDSHGVYFLMMGKNVGTAALCTKGSCGWHKHQWVDGVDVRYGVINDARYCGATSMICVPSPNRTTSPSGNVYADAMIATLGHELGEVLTDPDPDNAGYRSAGGAEIGDLCEHSSAEEWGTVRSDSAGGFHYNTTIGGRRYLVPQLWSNTTNACALN